MLAGMIDARMFDRRQLDTLRENIEKAKKARCAMMLAQLILHPWPNQRFASNTRGRSRINCTYGPARGREVTRVPTATRTI